MRKKVDNREERSTTSMQYHIPRRDAWYADLTEEERAEILTLPEKMNADKAIKYIDKKLGKKISRASYYRAVNSLNANRIVSAHLKAASTPPSLDVINDIAKTVKSIDKTLKSILQRSN